jgi:hypothetical protein
LVVGAEGIGTGTTEFIPLYVTMIKQQLQSIEPALQPGDQVHKTVSYAYSLTKSGVAVEKVAVQNFAEIPSRQDAPQTTFSARLDIFYPPNFP